MTMKKWFALGFCVGMISLGEWCTYEWLDLGGQGVMFKAGAFVAVFGLYLHYSDFIGFSREPL